MQFFDVIVIGAGHAGIEAGTASARIGAKTLILTNHIENLGTLSCNPSIGGVGKGIVVKEIDALDGIMGKACDLSSINRKNLNQSKGAAVWGPRHQIDRLLYKKAIKEILENYINLTILYDHIENFKILENNLGFTIKGKNEEYKARSLIITTGTFLGGQIILGKKRINAGRINENGSYSLSDCIKNLRLDMSRLKTGTPARINKHSINFEGLEIQNSDIKMRPMSYMNDTIKVEQIPCFMTYTNTETHKIIKDNFYQIPTVNGEIKFKGPRYCPSIEDKIRRFGDKDRHQIFLEPEGLNSDLIYPNGLSTSMSEELQERFLKSIKGLENSKIEQFGYAIEYDFIDPRELIHTLEVKKINNLFLAGQIIGTTGYEEAAGLGLIAGVNAALKSLNIKKEFILNRGDGYIGVMIDDLVTNGVDFEPYRLFTSRSEYRITCRSDNADIRLTKLGERFNLISRERIKFFKEKQGKYNELLLKLNENFITPHKLKEFFNIEINQDGIKRNGFDLIEKGLSLEQIKNIFKIENYNKDIEFTIENNAKYKTYILRQNEEIELMRKQQELKIPNNFDFKSIKSFSTEIIEKLEKIKPKDIAHASRIPGLTPVAINTLIKLLKT